MTYCTLEEALSLIGVTSLSGASAPTQAHAEAILATVEAEIDVHLAARANAAVADNLEYLRLVAMNGTAAKVAKAKWPAAGGVGSDQGVGATLREEYLAQLAFIDGGGLDATSAADDSATLSHGFQSSDGTAYTPAFTRDMEF